MKRIREPMPQGSLPLRVARFSPRRRHWQSWLMRQGRWRGGFGALGWLGLLACASVAAAQVGAGTGQTSPMPSMAPPLPGGVLGTLKLGAYVCEVPSAAPGGDQGDASVASLDEAGIAVPSEDFTIHHASIYTTRAGSGTYLFWGNTVEMTSGPKRGARFRRVTPNLLRRLALDGSEAPLRCIRQVLNNR